jgi:hypothetical protein
MTGAAGSVDGDSVLPDFDFEKFLNDFGATPGSFGEGIVAGPSSESGGPMAAALTPRFEDPLMGLTTGEFGFDMADIYQSENNVALDEVKMAGLQAFFHDAKALYAEIESWEDPIGHEHREARVLVGNKTHKLALMVRSFLGHFKCVSNQTYRLLCFEISSTCPEWMTVSRPLPRPFSTFVLRARSRTWVLSE